MYQGVRGEQYMDWNDEWYQNYRIIQLAISSQCNMCFMSFFLIKTWRYSGQTLLSSFNNEEMEA